MRAPRPFLTYISFGLVISVVSQDLFLSVTQEPEGLLPCENPDCEDFEGKVLPTVTWAIDQKSCQFPRDQSKCPQQVGSACPHNYHNSMDDYFPSSPQALVVDKGLRSFLESKVDAYLELVDQCTPPSVLSFDSADVFNGAGGRALMHLRLYSHGFQPAATKSYTSHLQRAREYIDVATKKMWTIPSKFCGFAWGSTGVNVLAAIIYDLQGDRDDAMKHVEKVRGMFRRAIDDRLCPYDDWDAGRSGLLFAAALLDYQFNKTMIDRTLVIAVANATLQRGARLGEAAGVDYMKFISPIEGGSWVGMSHGSAGVLYGILSYAPELLSDSWAKAKIVKTLDFIVSTQQPSGNFPTEYYNTTQDVLVQWDHGAPGVSATLLLAARLIPGSERWSASAEKALEVTWQRGLLTKGLMLCHGMGGNIYMQLFAYKQNGDKKYLHRALQFVRYVLQHPILHDVDEMRIPTPSPFLFWVGSWESAIMWASDFAANAHQPGKSAMPMFELTF